MALYALGGVTAKRVETLLQVLRARTAAASSGGRPAGVAVIGAVFGADDPVAAALVLARAMRRALAPL